MTVLESELHKSGTPVRTVDRRAMAFVGANRFESSHADLRRAPTESSIRVSPNVSCGAS